MPTIRRRRTPNGGADASLNASQTQQPKVTPRISDPTTVTIRQENIESWEGRIDKLQTRLNSWIESASNTAERHLSTSNPPFHTNISKFYVRRSRAETRKADDQLAEKHEELETSKSLLELERQELSAYVKRMTDPEASEAILPVTPDRARILEREFIGRFQARWTRENTRVYSPILGRFLAVSSAAKKSHSSRSADSVSDSTNLPAEPTSDSNWSYPKNTQVQYEVRTRPLGRRMPFVRSQPAVLIEAGHVTRIERYSEMGFDADPISVGELMNLIEPRIEKASKEGYFHVVGLGSPTGWAPLQRKQNDRTESNGVYLSPNLFLVLVNTVSGEVWHTTADAETRTNTGFFQLEFPWDRLEQCLNWIESRKAFGAFVTLDEIASTTEFKENEIVECFKRIADSGSGSIRRTREGVYLQWELD